jgi:hypothetical protein
MADKSAARDDGSIGLHLNAPYLALEVRSRRFGFAMFRASDLIDWGVRLFPTGKTGAANAAQMVGVLINLHAPSVVMAREIRRTRDSSSQSVARVMDSIEAKLRHRAIPLAILRRRDVARFFAEDGSRAKHDIAVLIADLFDVLKSRLPPPRKPWNHEAHHVAMFDAVATAIAWGSGVLPLAKDFRIAARLLK